jgi:hypothetical protein
MWSLGYTDHFADEGPEDVHMGDCSTFALAIRELYDNVQKMAVDADEYEQSYYEVILADILDIMNDPGITYNPDQWEDLEFYVLDGAITFFVVES